jgi:hypothetical protein
MFPHGFILVKFEVGGDEQLALLASAMLMLCQFGKLCTETASRKLKKRKKASISKTCII